MATRRMLLPFLAAGAAAFAMQRAAAASSNKTLVVVFQRFAADWINLLVPAGDPAYTQLRPKLAITNPLPLDPMFGLHPSLAPLQDLYNGGDLAFVTATGWLDPSARDRSHFKAQQLAELATPAQASSGWLARYLAQASDADSLWAALSAARSIPTSLQGFASAISLTDFSALQTPAGITDDVSTLARQLAALDGAAGNTSLRLSEMRDTVAGLTLPASADYPDTDLGNGLKLASQAIRAGLAPRIITVSSTDDWDTHVNQASRHKKSLPGFAQAIKLFHDELGNRLDDVVLVTMSEFGRKAKESLGGTDHGTGSSMMVMGRSVAGKRVYGDWPGLDDAALYQGEDLMPTTDYRSVLSEILVRHLQLPESSLPVIFPNAPVTAASWRQILGA